MRFVVVDDSTSTRNWVCAGNYKLVRELVWRRATHVVWIDLPHWIVLKRVLFRSFARAYSGREVFPGCRESWSKLLSADHPVRYAWTTHARRRVQNEAMAADPAHARLMMLRRRPVGQVRTTMVQLSAEFNAQSG
ncbi:MAG: hypothetical protein IV086_08165 [Hyphomonadaceae bacterium]|nr:hypothetical protein [Hyphomonadaceae bacterium]